MGLFWDLFVASTAIISVQTADISIVYNITALEGTYPRLGWTYPSSIDRIDWYHGDTNTVPILTYITVLGKETSSSEAEFISDVSNSVGIILKAVTRSSSGLYSVKVTDSDGSIAQSSTYLNVIQGDSIISINKDNQDVTPGESLQTGPTQLDVKCTAPGNFSVNCVYNDVDCGSCTNIPWSQQCTLNIYLEKEGTLSLTITITGIEGEYQVDFTVTDGNGLEPWLIAVIVVVVLGTCVILIVIIVLIIKKKSQTSKGQRAPMNYAVYR